MAESKNDVKGTGHLYEHIPIARTSQSRCYVEELLESGVK